MKRQQQPNDLHHGEAPPKKAEQSEKTAICKLPTGFLLDIMTKMPSEAVNDVRTASMEFDRVFLDHQELFQPPADMERNALLNLSQEMTPNADGTHPWTLSVRNNFELGDVSATCIKNYLRVAKNLSITIHGPLPNYFGGKTRPSKEEEEAEKAMKAEENEEIKEKLKADLETTNKGAGGITDLTKEEAEAVKAEEAEGDEKRKKKLKEDWERMKAIRERTDKSAAEKMKTFIAKECKNLKQVRFSCHDLHDPLEDVITIFECLDSPRKISVTFYGETMEAQNLTAILPKLVEIYCEETVSSESARTILSHSNLTKVNLVCSEFVETQSYIDEWKSGSRNIDCWFLRVPNVGSEKKTSEVRNDGKKLCIDWTVLQNNMRFFIRERCF